jgi:O-antigen ligase
LVLVLATGSRGPSIVTGIVFAGAVIFFNTGRSAWIRGLCAGSIVVAVLAYLPHLEQRTAGQGIAQGALSGREAAWDFLWTFFVHSPWWGNGLGASFAVADDSSTQVIREYFRAPHNTYLQLLVDMGVVGLTAVLVCLVGLTVQIWKSGTRQERILLGSLSIGISIYAYFDNLLTAPQPAVLYALMLACFYQAPIERARRDLGDVALPATSRRDLTAASAPPST